MTLTEQMAAYVTDYSIDNDEGAAQAARYNFLDTVGCTIAGTVTGQFELARQYADKYNGVKESMVLGSAAMTEAGHAALAHSVAAHACDYDDMCVCLNGHPGAVIVPVVLALADRLDKTGREMLTAYMAGVEVSAAFGRMFHEGNYAKAWNQTTALGIMGAVAAAGKIMGLSRDEMTHAFGITIGEASGNKANFGTTTKDLTVGMTALKAIKCAEFAKLGFTANRSVIEGNNGLFESLGNQISSRPFWDMMKHPVSVFLSPGLVIKPYPTCRGNHNVIDILVRILKENALKPEDIRTVNCKVQNTVIDTERYPEPKSGAEGKFCIAYCAALCILNGRLDIMDFQVTEISDPAVLEQMAKVRVTLDPTIVQARFGAEVTVETTAGQSFRSFSYYAKGDPLNPMSLDEIESKFIYNAALMMSLEDAKNLSDRLFDTDCWMNERHFLNQIEIAAEGKLPS